MREPIRIEASRPFNVAILGSASTRALPLWISRSIATRNTSAWRLKLLSLKMSIVPGGFLNTLSPLIWSPLPIDES